MDISLNLGSMFKIRFYNIHNTIMNILELFSGTGSVGKCCKNLGFNVISVDLVSQSTHQTDIMNFDYKQYPTDYFSLIWGSPPCQYYSHLQCSRLNRLNKKTGIIFTKEVWENHMKNSDKLVLKTLEIINYFKPELWFIENPQSGQLKHRNIMKDIPFYDVDYCKYSNWGYRKRTRIWTNKKEFNNKLCKADCGQICPGTKRHINNLGNQIQRNITGQKHIFTLQEKYRIPPDLIYSLICD